MNIALVSMNVGPLARLGAVGAGGQSVHIDGLARALSVLGHRVTIYARRDDLRMPRRLIAAAHVAIEFLDAGPQHSVTAADLTASIPAFGAALRDAWLQAAPDVVHTHGWHSAQAATLALAGRVPSIPIVATLHTTANRQSGRRDAEPATVRFGTGEQAALLRGIKRVIATSSAQVFALMELGASPGAMKLVPNGVDLELFAPRAPRPLSLSPQRRLRIVTLGRLARDKGAADVIEALAYIDGAEVVLGGGNYAQAGIAADPDAVRLMALAKTRNVADRLELCGRIERTAAPAFLRSADIVVCMPRFDSLGTVALEAMACGVPVVVSAVGGLVDAVVDGMTGIHVPPSDPRQLAYAIERLAGDAHGRERMGRFGIERVAARNRWSRIASETFAIYRSVVSGPLLAPSGA